MSRWLVMLLVLCVASPAAHATDPIRFNETIRPILRQHCLACHGGVKRAGGLSFIYRETTLGAGESGLQAVVPKDPDGSYLLERVLDEEDSTRMPPQEHGPRLTKTEVDLLRRWIEQGAEWEEPWSFVPPRVATLPEVERKDWPRDPLDHFVLARLEREGLAPSAEAGRTQWLRRASFDLTGLPPTVEEYAIFESDRDAAAYEHAVDRMLASPAYGERWASVWLDLARYSDTMGYEKDPHRDIWPYRDWLIRALNADMPFDEFTIKQLAGDMLPGATIDDRLASAFHRNTPTNVEGGTDDEEYRIAAVIDRVSVTWQAWMGTTFACVQCHAHPYDPIEHDEFYKCLAIFNSSRDADQLEEEPKLRLPLDAAESQQAERLNRGISELTRSLHAAAQPLLADEGGWSELAFDRAKSTLQTKLAVKEVAGHREVWAEGTISGLSKFKLSAPAPPGLSRITAVRIEALPKDPVQAVKIPEQGFEVSRLKLLVQSPSEKEPVEVFFRTAFADEPEPISPPQQSFEDDPAGWGVVPSINRPRHAVFVLEQPVELRPGTRVTLELKQDRLTEGEAALVIQRGRYALTSDPRWTELVDSAEYRSGSERLAELVERRKELKGVAVPVMEECEPGLGRATQVFVRGNWLERGETVTPGLPSSLPPLPQDQPVDRLALARWMVSPENPLTARVLVNRLWEQLFGVGIVETVEDLGSAGEPPSHPELLDSLAVRMQGEMGWSIKAMLRSLVLSSTYRQNAAASPEQIERDPKNRLLARGPRCRLRAEMVRDQALAVSGKLSQKMYGPPVMPYQPEGVWNSIYSSAAWELSSGEDRYRRSVYTYWKRTSGYPSMLTFDMTPRNVCTPRRVATNTPLQALVTLNDPAFVDLYDALAERMLREGGATLEERIDWAFRATWGRSPSPQQAARMAILYYEALVEAETNRTKKLSTKESSERPQADSSQRFALSIVAGALLNLDESLTK